MFGQEMFDAAIGMVFNSSCHYPGRPILVRPPE
jgi:hypothetical protein